MRIFFPIIDKKRKDDEESEEKRLPLHIYNVPEENLENSNDNNKKKSNNDFYIDVNKEFEVDFTLDIFWDSNDNSIKDRSAI